MGPEQEAQEGDLVMAEGIGGTQAGVWSGKPELEGFQE